MKNIYNDDRYKLIAIEGCDSNYKEKKCDLT